MKIDVKQILTFAALFVLTNAVMAADFTNQINSTTSKGIVVFRGIAAGIAALAIIVEGLRMVLTKKPVLRELGYIIGGLILIVIAVEAVSYFYSSNSSAGF